MEDVRRLSVGEEDEARVGLDDLAREGARRMIAAALEAEVEEYVGAFVGELDEDGRRLVVRNGRARERKLTVGSGTVAIKAPRVNDKRVDVETGERQRFTSRILPAYARRSPKVTEVLPVLYLHGLSTGDFGSALRDLLGEDAAGLSPASISRLTKAWQTGGAGAARPARVWPERTEARHRRRRSGGVVRAARRVPRRGRAALLGALCRCPGYADMVRRSRSGSGDRGVGVGIIWSG